MVKPRKKDLTDQQRAGADSMTAGAERNPPMAPEQSAEEIFASEGQTLQDAMTNQLPTATLAPPATPTTAVTTNEAAQGEPGEKKWTEAPDPFGRYNIDLGDGRRLRFFRSNRFQQVGISFYSNDESVDPKPSGEETEWLKSNGFDRYRPQAKGRTMQLVSQDQKEEIDEMEDKRGEQSAKFLRAKFRMETDLAAEQAFVEFANSIRVKNGLEPVESSIGERARF
jgi:hypothetical protein